MTRRISLGLLLVFIGIGASPATRPAATPTTRIATTQPRLEPVPLLSPEEEIRTFNLPPGVRAQVVACEPMVEHPVAIAFDSDGRLWVAEMRNYMPDVYGTAETKPTGRISILEDTDGDGRMDKKTVFLDKLVLPRAIGFAREGVLVGTPPNLLFCRDTDGDGKCDEQRIIASDYGVPENPENFANGLLWNLDNWLYNADYEKRFRFDAHDVPTSQPTANLGQWGITRDDAGRMFFNTNSDYLRGALVPPHYSVRNRHSPMTIADTQIAKDQTVWPAHAATVNRGYRPGFLRADGSLVAFTAACSPHIYRGNLFPEFYGNAFVCEAASNLVRRAIITENGAKLTAANAYDHREFIASTYERFRPVNIQTGPDGALYIVDMHHGLIQHRMSLTQYGKDQYRAKQLDKHLMTGRIFRIIPDGGAPGVQPRLTQMSTDMLVRQLTHPNGWWRDTAQRLLVERNDPAAEGPLREIALHGKSAAHRLAALWTLDGVGQLDPTTIAAALKNPDAKVRANAIRLSEGSLNFGDVYPLRNDPDPYVRLQFELTVGGIGMDATDSSIVEVLLNHGDDPMIREAAVSGIAGREIAFLKRILDVGDDRERSEAKADVITDIARSITRRYAPGEMLDLAELIGAQPSDHQWQQLAMLEAIPQPKHDDFGTIREIDVAQKPAAIEMLASSTDEPVRKQSAKLAALFRWPGKPQAPRPKPVELNAKQKQLMDLGRQTYATVCAQCHHADGTGQPGKAPPLINSPWVLGPQTRIIRILLHGVRGPLTVGGHAFNLDMPGLAALSDDQIAGVLTYVRRSWGHEAPPIDPPTVQNIRDWTQARRDGWTEKELLQLK